MKRKIILFIALFTAISYVLYALHTRENATTINLRLTKKYKEETIEKQKTGLIWALSYLGAELPAGSFEKAFIKKDSLLYELDVSKVGFTTQALDAFKIIINSLKESEEYHIKKGIDCGAFIIYTLGSSWHYYKITGAAKTLNEYKKKYNYTSPTAFPVTNSMVASHHRMIEIAKAETIDQISYIATEGEGNIKDKTFNPEIVEVLDFMPNGQLRFAVYNKEGNLLEASPKKFGNAGKPAKCLWCHEIVIQPLFSKNEAFENYMSPDSFNLNVVAKMNMVEQYRSKLNSDLHFENRQDHALMEIFYISYMQPSIYKLAGEWGIAENELLKKFKDHKTHTHREYPFMGNLFDRADIKYASPYTIVPLPDSIWEPNQNEPNLFR